MLEVLPIPPTGFAQAAITSPPYWGFRDYGVRPRVWGGDSGYRHRWGPPERGPRTDMLPADKGSERAAQQATHEAVYRAAEQATPTAFRSARSPHHSAICGRAISARSPRHPQIRS